MPTLEMIYEGSGELPELRSDKEKVKGCNNCGNRCMDMDMDPYCAAVNKPWGLNLCKDAAPKINFGRLIPDGVADDHIPIGICFRSRNNDFTQRAYY